MSPVHVEVRRILLQRVCRIIVGCLLLMSVLCAVAVSWQSRPPSGTERAVAQSQVEHELQLPTTLRHLASCRHRPATAGGNVGAETVAHCVARFTPQLNDYLPHRALNLTALATTGLGLVIGLAIAALCLVLGSVSAGNDWSSGSIENQLLVVPHRGRLWIAKGLACIAVGAAVSAAGLIAFWAPVLTVAGTRRAVPEVFIGGQLLPDVLRTIVLAMAACMFGFAASFTTKSAIGGLALPAAWWLLSGPLLSALGGSAALGLGANLVAIVRGSYRLYDRSVACGRPTCDLLRDIHSGSALGYALAGVLAGCAVSMSLFRGRDI